MKIVTWNMRWGGSEETWQYLVDEIAPDLAFLQEAHPPSKYAGESLLYQRIPRDNYRWGSAIYSPRLSVRERMVTGHEGWVVAGEVTLSNGAHVVVVSIYGSLIANPKAGYVFPNLANLFQHDLQPLLAGKEFILGGDLNASRLFDKVYPNAYASDAHGDFFDWIESHGFVNCHKMFHETEEQTVFTPQTKHPYQNDYLFVSEGLRPFVTSCYVLNNSETLKLSDHIPVVLELDV
ncbi:MAG TPA: endonuclease/exonuclease/phosphatase family protein [Chloroflexia bacterium]|nr:endonuclease/exonuclease/phosphatase family protein [Chloroflexia bacterium]